MVITKKHAIEILDPNNTTKLFSTDEMNEACLVGIMAISKQIPKALIKTFNSRASECPTCRNFVISASCMYCPSCGQAFDREQEDD